MSRWQVLHGDSLVLLPQLGECAADVVLCDPPYTAHVHDKARTLGPDGPGAIPINFPPADPAALGPLLIRTAKRWAIAFCALEQLGQYAEAAGYEWARSGIYRKTTAMPQLTGDRPANACEGIAIMHRFGRKRWSGGGSHAFWEDQPVPMAETGHPTAKPVALMMRLVELFTEPGETILDPFCGSGTTGVAALRLGRKFIGIDMDERYADLARARLTAEENGTTVKAVRDGQCALFGKGAA